MKKQKLKLMLGNKKAPMLYDREDPQFHISVKGGGEKS